jgi:hypothetical protein
MRPFTVLIGILAGSAASTTFGLAVVLVVFAVLAGRDPDPSSQLPREELPRLVLNLIVFSALTAASACSLLGQLRVRPWRIWAHAATLACLVLMVFWYWPKRA